MFESIKCRVEPLISTHLFAAEWKISDWVFYFLLVPALLIIIFELPAGIKEAYFILTPPDITAHSLFLSNYTHSNLSHFTGNLVSYLATCFLIFNFETNKRSFRVYSIFMFLLLPWIISAISMYMLGFQATYQGFSGIVSSMFGYLTYAIYKFLHKFCCKHMNLTFLALIIVMNLLLVLGNISAQVFQYSLIITFALILVYMQKEVIIEVLQKHFEFIDWLEKFPPLQKIYLVIIVLAVINFIFILPDLVPQEVMQNGVYVNSVGHYTGYFFGIFVPIILGIIFD
ncbi:hypothetical protein RE474_07660 [Methanolobus sediminis]|uniref:Peptidase S54 rhomboid domain-containing protein n=1 Tax=Methanolobus sediminis TaxID=3072978 RepID=A0AA51UI75_9EURY|nr:hypothetical protein [Methanolobus sediminis]WMW23977.1 hypothetical protein RE474_07660 [Methanolobus sediminis]